MPAMIVTLQVVLPEGQIEAAVHRQFRRPGTAQDARHAVISQPRRAAEDERVAGLQKDRVDGIAARGDRYEQELILERVAAIVDRFPVPGLPQTLVAGPATA